MTSEEYRAMAAAVRHYGENKKRHADERNAPHCGDSRDCRFRSLGRCTILTGTYERDGKCPYCKEKKGGHMS